MKQKFLLKTMLLLCILVGGVSPAWADDFELYSGSLTEGDYLIVYNGGAMNTTINNDRLQYQSVSVNNGKITTTESSLVWHIAKSGDYWTLYNATAKKYAASTGAKNKAQMLESGTDDKSLWTITGTSPYEFVNKKNTANNVNSNLRRNGDYGFACYATSTGGALSLYKKVESTPSGPSITANEINIAYDATNGSIGYSLSNAEGNVSASVTTGDWLILDTENITASAVPFTCSANTATTPRSAQVTLSFTGATNKVVTVTQAGRPNVISDITATSTAYTVVGTVVATNNRGFVIGDGTGYVYTYLNATPSQSVGDKVKISGTTGTYGQIIQFTNSATITAETTSAYDGTPAATVINAVPDYSTGLHLSTYLQFEGELEESSSNYYITVGSDQIQISYPTTAQASALSALDGKTVRVKGYFSGNNSSGYFSVMMESVEEVTNPTLSADPATAQAFNYVVGNGPSADQMFTVTGTNLVSADITATVSNDYEITDNTEYSSSVTIASGAIVSVRLKAGLAKGEHNGTLTLSSTDATNVVINLSGTVTGQTYAIEQYTSPATAHGTITFSPASPIEDGTEVTLSAEPAEGYTFTADSWVIYKQSGEDYVVDNSITVTANKFNMPAYAIWVDGTFNAKPTYAITCVADPVAGGEIISDLGNAYNGQTVTLSYTENTGYKLSSIVITKTSDGSATGITPTVSGDNFTFTMPDYAVTATATFEQCFTWDLSKDSYASANKDLVTWSSTYATMTNAKGSSNSDANAYLGGSGTHEQTRFYQHQIITFTPATGYKISKVEIVSTNSTYAGYFNTTWTNASSSVNGSVVTITPKDKDEAFYVILSSATRATEVKVYYQTSTIPYITASDINIACDATTGAIAYAVNNPKDGGALTAELTTCDWLELGDVSTNIPFTTTANNTKVDRTATVTLTYTYDTSKTTTKVVTITQAGDPNAKDAPTIPDYANANIAYGSTYTVDDTGVEGGQITVSSENTSVATVSGLVITPVAVGTVTIRVSTAENATYSAGSKTFILTITAPEGKNSTALFYESFDKNTANQGGNDGNWDQGSGTSITYDNTSGITLSSSAYAAYQCVRLGTGSNQGSATITIPASVGDVFTLSFKAAPWNAETSTKAAVSVTGGTITGISADVMATKQWTEYEGTITASAQNVEIEIASTGSKRFFLDEVKIEEAGVVNTANVTLNKYGYATYCSVCPIDFSSTTGYTAWRISSVSTDGTITFAKVTDRIKGGQGVLLYNKDADGVNTSNVTINFADGTTVFEKEENKFFGTTAPTFIEADTYYGLKDNKFVKVNAGTIPAGKALLPADVIPTTARELNFVFEGEQTTSVSEECRVKSEEFATATIFDLQGRKVNKPQKGLYIVNGRKVVVK